MKIKKGRLVDDRLSEISPIEGAYKGGIYLGSPGADIFYSLPYLTECQIDELAIEFSKKMPFELPSAHDNVSACIRLTYGRLVKNGILLSKLAIDDVKKEIGQWDCPRKFLKKVYDNLKKSNNNYGLTILCLIEAHRLGDEAVIYHDSELLSLMMSKYEEGVGYAKKCNSKVHLFSSYYWGARYYVRYGDVENAVVFFKKSIDSAHNFSPGYRPGFFYKMKTAFKYVRDNKPDEWHSFHKFYRKNGKSKLIEKAVKNVK
jgi:tetratricopeptide (TPR) repeat protein